MIVTNNGKGIVIKASYIEAAIITEAIRKGASQYEREGAPISDYLWFYGFNGGCIVLSIFMLFKILTF